MGLAEVCRLIVTMLILSVQCYSMSDSSSGDSSVVHTMKNEGVFFYVSMPHKILFFGNDAGRRVLMHCSVSVSKDAHNRRSHSQPSFCATDCVFLSAHGELKASG